jgi:hypothetical protein
MPDRAGFAIAHSPQQPFISCPFPSVVSRGGFKEISPGVTEWLVKPAPTISKNLHKRRCRT